MYGRCLRCDKPSQIRVYYKGDKMATIYSEKIDEFISQLENEMIEINLDIKKLETEKQVYQKILDDLRELKSL